MRTKHIQSVFETTQRQDNRCEWFAYIFHLPKEDILKIDTTEADAIDLESEISDE